MYETYNYICRIVGLRSEPFDQPSCVCVCVGVCVLPALLLFNNNNNNGRRDA